MKSHSLYIDNLSDIYLHNWEVGNLPEVEWLSPKFISFNCLSYQQFWPSKNFNSIYIPMIKDCLPAFSYHASLVFLIYQAEKWKQYLILQSLTAFILFLLRLNILSDVCCQFIIYYWRPIQGKKHKLSKVQAEFIFFPVLERNFTCGIVSLINE